MTTLHMPEELSESQRSPREIRVPAPTAWPLVLAFGCSLLFAGLVTSVSVSLLGAVLSLAGCIGWFREVFPREHEETVPVLSEDIRITTDRRLVERVSVPAYQRAWLPVHTYPISAGVKGGFAGSVAMAVLACAYGVLKAGSILVSHQSACSCCLLRIAETRTHAVVFVSGRQFCNCFGPPRAGVNAGRIDLWRDASHVSAQADRIRRTYCSRAVVGIDLHDSRSA